MSNIQVDGTQLKAAGCGVFTGAPDAYLSMGGYKSDAERKATARATDGAVLRPTYAEFPQTA